MDNSGRGEDSNSSDTMKMLDSCIYYYLKKNNMRVSAEAFALEANLLHLPPDGAECILTKGWQSVVGPMASSSLVQPKNVMGNVQQSVHGKSPVVVHQPVPLGADMGSMMMTGQQPAGRLLASNNYQAQLPAEAQERGAKLTRPQDQSQVQRLAQSLAQTQPQTRTQALALIRSEGEREAQERANRLELASSTNVSSQQVRSLTVAAQTQQHVPPRPGNVMGNPQQSIHGKAPVVIYQPVPLGTDMDTMLITGQQPAAHLMASNNYQGQQPTEQGQGQEPAPPLFEIQAAEVNQDRIWRELEHQEQAAPTRPQVQRLAQRVAQGQGQGYSSQQVRSLTVAAQTQQHVPPRPDNVMGNAQQRIHGKAPVVVHQPVPLGAYMDNMMMTGQQPAAHLLASNNYHGQQPAEARQQSQGHYQGQGHAPRIAQAEADREARSQARPISRLQAGAPSTNVRSQQVRSLTVAAQTQHQVTPRPDYVMGNAQQSRHGKAPVVVHQPVPLGAYMNTMMMTGQQPAGHLLASNNYHGQQSAEALEHAQGQGHRHGQGQGQAQTQQVRSLTVAAQTQHLVPPRGNRGGASQGRSIIPGNEASTGANQQRSEEADVSKETGSRSKKRRLN